MECVSPLFEIGKCLWQSGEKRSGFLLNFDENLEALETRTQQLNKLNQDVKTRLEQEEKRQQMKRTNQVDAWLRKVEETEAQVTKFLQQAKEETGKKCFQGKNCRTSYKLGKQVIKLIAKVDELRNQGNFEELAHKLPRAPADELPMENTVGWDSTFENVWRSIEEKSVKIVGLFGIGGVGKTTLLKRINNQFANIDHDFANIDHDFAMVIWIVVSKQVDVDKIQENIRNKLEISDFIWKNRSEDERAAEIFKLLKGKKVLVLLDDLWQRLDLSKVGIPLPDNENKSKLIFTTRSEEVCAYMGADRRIRVECLPERAALDLFCKMVGEETLKSHQEIPKLAEIVAGECKGLPLALITIGRSMASRKNPKEWKHAIKSLQSYPSKFSGMQDHVFPILEFSYDSLSDETVKNCFLYCSLFPEDYMIPKDELINLWIGEGFLDKSDSTLDARNEGEYVIGSLKLACLLEGGEFEDYLGISRGGVVWMHDVIRDMALWLACERGKKQGKFLVKDCPGAVQACPEEVEKMSLWGHHLVNVINGIPNFPNLQTMLVRELGCNKFPSEFLHHVQRLRVLDLSGNCDLVYLPEGIGELINLYLLDLSGTAIFELPTEIKNLKNLKRLTLDSTRFLRVIPRDVIPSLVSLQGFSKLAISDIFYDEDFNEVQMLDDLERLQKLDDLTIMLSTKTGVEKFMDSPDLQDSIRQLSLMACSEMETFDVSFSSMRRMNQLEKLDIRFCHSMSELKVYQDLANAHRLTENQPFCNLRVVHIRICPVKDLSWLLYAPNLETLELYRCLSIEEVIRGNCDQLNVGAKQQLFSNLSNLCLNYLPNLKCISQQDLCFPALTKISVYECPNLKKLPLDSSNNLKIIRGEKSWWDQLQWENQRLKDDCGAKFAEWDGSLYLQPGLCARC